MRASRKRGPMKPPTFRFGQRVRFQYVTQRVSGRIIEDCGPLRVGGVQLYAVRAKLGRVVPMEIVLELPADQLHEA